MKIRQQEGRRKPRHQMKTTSSGGQSWGRLWAWPSATRKESCTEMSSRENRRTHEEHPRGETTTVGRSKLQEQRTTRYKLGNEDRKQTRLKL